MAQELIAIRNILDRLLANEESDVLEPAFKNEAIANSFVIYGVMDAGTKLRKNFINIVDTIGLEDDIEAISCKPMTNREILLASRCALREAIHSVHYSYTKKGISFTINNLSIKGMGERNKEIMRIIWWCDTQIKEIVDDIMQNPEDDDGNFIMAKLGTVIEMKRTLDEIRY